MQLHDLITKLPAIAERLERLDVITPVRPRQIPNFRAHLPAIAVTTSLATC
jgi:hypothetical protein